MSLEEMAKKYSEKWGVPIEEATRKVKEFVDKKPGGPGRGTPDEVPDVESMLPPALGAISKKIRDINVAALSTAYTHKTLRDLSQPPEELETLREKVDFFEKNLGQMMELVNTTMRDMQTTLEAQKAETEKQALFAELDEKVIKPLKEKIEVLEAAKGGNKGALGELTPENIFEAGKKMTADAEALLKSRGYHVDLPKGLTLEEVEAKIKEAVGKGKKEWAEKAGADVEIEKERIRATEEILTGITDRIFTIFLDPLKDKIHEAIEKGAFSRKAATGS